MTFLFKMNVKTISKINRYRAIVKLFPETLERLFLSKEDFKIRANLPDDTKIVYMNWNASTNSFDLIVESEDFPPISEGMALPILDDALQIIKAEDYYEQKIGSLKE